MKKIKVLSCISTVAIMALIFFFSAQTASVSSSTSGGLTKKIAEILSRIFQTVDFDEIYYYIHVFIRKTAHFVLFFSLGLSGAISIHRLFEMSGKNLFISDGLFCLFYAITDEVHQLFVPGRAFMFRDIFIDFAGSICGCLIYLLLYKIYLRRQKNAL